MTIKVALLELAYFHEQVKRQQEAMSRKHLHKDEEKLKLPFGLNFKPCLSLYFLLRTQSIMLTDCFLNSTFCLTKMTCIHLLSFFLNEKKFSHAQKTNFNYWNCEFKKLVMKIYRARLTRINR